MSLEKFDPVTGLLEGYKPQEYLAYEITPDFSTCKRYTEDQYKSLEASLKSMPDRNKRFDPLPALIYQPLCVQIQDLMYDHDLIVKFLSRVLKKSTTRVGYAAEKLKFSVIYQIPLETLPLLINHSTTDIETPAVIKWRLENNL